MEVISKEELLSVLKRYHERQKNAYAAKIKSCLHGVQTSADGKLQFVDGSGNVVAETEFKSGVNDGDIATNNEVTEMLDEIFNGDSQVVDESDIATNAEVAELLDDIFGSEGVGGTGEEIATNDEVQELLDDIFKN